MKMKQWKVDLTDPGTRRGRKKKQEEKKAKSARPLALPAAVVATQRGQMAAANRPAPGKQKKRSQLPSPHFHLFLLLPFHAVFFSAWEPSRKPFLARRGRSLRWRMRPVPVVLRRMALLAQLSVIFCFVLVGVEVRRRREVSAADRAEDENVELPFQLLPSPRVTSSLNHRAALSCDSSSTRKHKHEIKFYTHTCGCARPGSRTTSTSTSGCGRSSGRSACTACASCCGAYLLEGLIVGIFEGERRSRRNGRRCEQEEEERR